MPDLDINNISDDELLSLVAEKAKSQGISLDSILGTEPVISDSEYLPTDVRVPLNTLMENRPGGQEDYLRKLGYEVTRDKDGNLAGKAPGESVYKKIEPEGILGGGNGFLGGLKELGLDAIEGSNNVLASIPNALGSINPAKAPLKALGLDVGLGVLGNAPTETITDAGAKYLGVGTSEETGDPSILQRGVGLGALQGAMNTTGNVAMNAASAAIPKTGEMLSDAVNGLGDTFSWARNSKVGKALFGTPEKVEEVGMRKIASVLDAPADTFSGGKFVDEAGKAIPRSDVLDKASFKLDPTDGKWKDATGNIVDPSTLKGSFFSDEVLNKIGLESPAETVLDAMKNDYGFFDSVKRQAEQTGLPYHVVADKILKTEGQAVGNGIEKVVAEISNDPATTSSFGEWADVVNKIKNETKESLGAAFASSPEFNTASFAREIDSVVNNQVELVRNAAEKTVENKALAIAERIKPLEKELKPLLQKISPLQEVVDNGRTLAPKSQSRYATLKTQIAKLQSEIDAGTTEYVSLSDQKKNPPISFLDIWKVKVGIRNAASTFRNENADTPTGIVLKKISGGLGKYSDDIANRTTNKNLSESYGTLAKKYSTYMDMADYTAKAFGKMFQEAPTPTLLGRLTGRSYLRTEKGGLAPRITSFFTKEAPSARQTFKEGVDALSTPDPMRLQTSLAQGAKAAQAVVKPAPTNLAISSMVGRSISAPGYARELGKQILLHTLVSNGVINEEQTRTGVDLDTLDQNAVMQSQQLVQQVTEPLDAAMTYGDENDVGFALSTIAKQFPMLFPPSKTGINGEVEIGGEIKLYDPMDRAKYTDMLIKDDSLSSEDKAKTISELNRTFTVKQFKKRK